MKIVLSLLTLSLAIAGCSSSGRGRLGAPFCKQDYKSHDFEVPGASSKTDLAGTDDLALADGTYMLTGYEFYVNDQEKGIRIHVSAEVDENGETKSTNVECIGWDKADAIVKNMPISYSLDAISKIIVHNDQSQKTTLGGGDIILDIRDRGPNEKRLQTQFQLNDSKTAQKSLKKTYEGYSDKTQFLFTLKNSYQLLNRMKDSDNVLVESRQIWKKSED